MRINFSKMHGLGNDYIYISCLEHELEKPAEFAIKFSDRHFGIGADGAVLICPSKVADFRMRMFNADGSEAEMCGNAIRCVGKYVFDRHLTDKKQVSIETLGGIKQLELEVRDSVVVSVRVNMGAPILEPSLIPVLAERSPLVNQPYGDSPSLRFTAVSMGNPHAVFFVPEITDELVLGAGPKIEKDPIFPKKVNVEFVKVLTKEHLQMRVWERGSGETWACGTGAAAVLVAAVLNNLSERKARVSLRGGDLELEWAEDGNVYKKGPACFVYDGVCEWLPNE